MLYWKDREMIGAWISIVLQSKWDISKEGLRPWTTTHLRVERIAVYNTNAFPHSSLVVTCETIENRTKDILPCLCRFEMTLPMPNDDRKFVLVTCCNKVPCPSCSNPILLGDLCIKVFGSKTHRSNIIVFLFFVCGARTCFVVYWMVSDPMKLMWKLQILF